jgi:hypothetical protein
VQILESIKDPFKYRDFLGLHFCHKWFTHFGVPMNFQDFVTHFLDGVLSQNMMHIDDILTLGNTHVALGILSSCVDHWFFISVKQYLLLPSYLFWQVST